MFYLTYCRSVLVFVCLCSSFAFFDCHQIFATAKSEIVRFDVPEGKATKTLKIAAQQSGIEFIFSASAVRGVRTQPIQGEFNPVEAFNFMLAGSSLAVFQHEKSGVYTIRKAAVAEDALGDSKPVDTTPMNENKKTTNGLFKGLLALAVAISPNLSAQEEDELFELSPFSVDSSGDIGYRAQNTLAGTRMNTNLADTPAAISAYTKELLDDIGAESVEDYLIFGANTDRDVTTDGTGLRAVQADAVVKIRGFINATLTRNYFSAPISVDRYNVDRIDISKGPNAVLYGIGGPGGVLNTTTKRARIGGNNKSISATIGKHSKFRTELDFNFTLVEDKLALRVNSLLEDSEDWQDFEYRQQEALALAVTYKPFERTIVRAEVEHNDRDVNDAFPFPAMDLGGTRYIKAGAPISPNPLDGENPAPDVIRFRNFQQILFAPQLRDQPFRLSSLGEGVDVRPDLEGIQASGFWEPLPGPNSPIIGRVADLNFDVVPENANLNGPGNRLDNHYTNSSIFVEQSFGDLSIEAGYNKFVSYLNSNFPVQWNILGVKGDPNAVIPGAYYADGDSSTAGDQSLGTPLPASEIGRVNPFAGELYVESLAGQRYQVRDHDNYRVSAAYELDLSENNEWLGTHTIAGLWQYDDQIFSTGVYRQYNTNGNNNDLIDAAANQIWHRTYLDFDSPDGLRGLHDPWNTQIPTDTGVRAEFLHFRTAPLRSTKNDSQMIAVQSKILKDYLTLTAGYREDTQTANVATLGAVKLPNSRNLYSQPVPRGFEKDRESSFTGGTTTFGAVFRPLDWLGFHYNESDSVLPQATTFDILNRSLKNRSGIGEDYGVRFELLQGKVYATVNKYKTSDTNQALNRPRLRSNNVSALNRILETMAADGQPLPSILGSETELRGEARDLFDLDGEGLEVEIVGNLTDKWSLSVNYSESELQTGVMATIMGGFLADQQSAWDGNMTLLDESNGEVENFVNDRDNTPDRDYDLEPATFNDAYDFAVAAYEGVILESGNIPLSHVEESMNFFTSYRFGEEGSGVLKNARIGLGGNYRGPPVIGYDSTNGNAPIYGDSFFNTRLMLGKTIPLNEGRRLDLQLNLNNLFGEEDILPWAATSEGISRWSFQRNRQRWDLRAVYSF